MIDHVSLGVKDLAQATIFYEEILGILGSQKLIEHTGTVGFGKNYPEFWLNHRPALVSPKEDNGNHICLRAPSVEVVDEFYSQAIRLGATSSGAPGFRTEYHESYYACFIRDADNNHFEVVTFVPT
jgi:catechol 2,3-dioxygenase-like lactoylglutathione lyase family enzyme